MTQCAPPPPCDLDEEYYWHFVTFSAQGRLFRVPKYRLLSDSEQFASKYGLDRDSSSEHEYGTVEDPQLNAVKLDDVRADEFRAFLKAIYPKVIRGPSTLTKDQWLSVLKLSTKWFFNDLRKDAIEELSRLDIDPTEKIQLGKEYNVEPWLLSGCYELISRKSVISIEDAEKIHWKFALSLYIIRDGTNCKECPDIMDDATIYDHVRRTFSADFERIRSCQDLYLTTEEKLIAAQEEEERERKRREQMEKEARDCEMLERERLEREREERERLEREEVAAMEAELHHLELLAAEEKRRMAEFSFKLENRRQNLQSITSPPPTKIPEEHAEGAESSSPKILEGEGHPEPLTMKQKKKKNPIEGEDTPKNKKYPTEGEDLPKKMKNAIRRRASPAPVVASQAC